MAGVQGAGAEHLDPQLQRGLRLPGQVLLAAARLYLYGGYQILNGALADFYRIALDDDQTTYQWEEVAQGHTRPGSRSKHALLATKARIYLIGGLKGNNEASNEIFEFHPESSEWTLLHPEGSQLPPIESFSAVTVSKEEERIIIGFGFNEELSSASNAIYEFTPAKNRLSVLFEGTDKAKPCTSPPMQRLPAHGSVAR